MLLWVLAGSTLLCATVFALKYSGQPLLDLYSFRQTQTALTSFWLAQEGFRLAYETPVGGYPWSIPFEFPLYQYLVTLLSSSTGLKLDVVGRVLSFGFLAACLVPVRSIIDKLKLSEHVLPVFIAVLFSSPVYLYWGRTFMMETAALFFAVSTIPFFINITKGEKLASSSVFFVIFATLCILQKATTWLPLLAVLSLVYVWTSIKAWRSAGYLAAARGLALAGVIFGVPLLVGVAWTTFTDSIKSASPFGSQLTSAALSEWNWGTLSQRVSSDLYVDVLWQRVFVRNLAGPLGLVLFVWALSRRLDVEVKRIVWVALAAGVLPLFFFSNLHLVHDYYQTANVFFLLFGLSVIVGELVPRATKHKSTVVIVVALIVASNSWAFSNHYLGVAKTNYSRYNSRIMAIAEVLRREVPEGHSFIAFGNDWSASLAYLAERKSFTVPVFFNQYDDVLRRPDDFVGDAPLGAIVVCPTARGPNPRDLLAFAVGQRDWHLGLVHSCLVAMPSRPLRHAATQGERAACEGNLEHVGDLVDGQARSALPDALLVAGWTTLSGSDGTAPRAVFVTVTDESGRTSLHEAVRAPREDVRLHFKRHDMADSGFSSLIDVSGLSGRYQVGISRMAGDVLEQCQFVAYVDIKPAKKH